jgi:hypothetical protein
MNKRIRELYNQSLVVQNDDAQWIENELDSEKFAELIVRECAETIQDFVDHRFPASEYPVLLKRYFGVE